MPLAPRLALASILALTACTEVLVVDAPDTGTGGAAPTTTGATTATAGTGAGSTTATSGTGGSACTLDTTADPHNCGACGHDCLGGACLLGACQPVELAKQDGQPWEIALDGTHVYWSNTAGPISKVAKHGGATIVLTSDLSNPGQLSRYGGRVYSASFYGTVVSVGIDGGALVPLIKPIPGGLAATTGAKGVYWVTGQPAPEEKQVVHTDFDGKLTTVLASAQHEPTVLAVDATHVYWTDYVDEETGDGGIRRAPLAGGVTETLASKRSLVAMALDESRAYYLFGGTSATSWGDGAVYAVPKTGGAPVLIADGIKGAARLAVDGSHVYWTEAYSFSVRRAPKQGGATEVLAEVKGNPQGIAVDDEAVYWVDPGVKTVMKLAK